MDPNPGEQPVDLTSFDGFHYPPDAPTVTWPGGRFKTKLPYLANSTNPAVNDLKADAAHVENIAKTATLTSKWVVRLDYNGYSNDREFASAVANETKHGRTVVVSGHPYRPAAVELDDLNLRFNFVEDNQVYASGRSNSIFFSYKYLYSPCFY